MPGNAAAVKKQEELAPGSSETAFGQATDQTTERLLGMHFCRCGRASRVTVLMFLQFQLR